MGRRILNRKDLRADHEAAELRKVDDEDKVEDGEEEAEDDEEVDSSDEAEGDGEEETEAADDEEVDEETPKKRKVVKAKVKAKPKPRTRTPKVIRMKVLWGVFNNSNQRVAIFDYPRRKAADEMAAKLSADKKTTHFVQPIKEPLEEKKE